MLSRLFRRATVSAALCVTTAAAASGVDPNLPTYQAKSGISGNVTSIGSDTLANLMALWSEQFKKEYPNVNIEVQAAGSSTAPPALTNGTSNLGPMSRKMKAQEVKAFEEALGYKPTAIKVAIDALAVFVNKDNPIKGLSIPQVDAIFSATRKCRHPEDITTWGQVGLSGEWSNRSIQLFGRNSVSGTYGYFKKRALCKGDFKNTVNEQPGSASVVQSISTSNNAIGYSGIGYVTSDVRAVPLSKKTGGTYIPASEENVKSGDYPLARYLYVYVNKHPNRPLDPVAKEFLSMVLSKQGQNSVVKDGYVPLEPKTAQAQLKLLD